MNDRSETQHLQPSVGSEFLGDSAVWTPEIERLIKAVIGHLRLEQPGMMVDGPQRNGKSWAITYLAGSLSSLFGAPVCVVRWTIAETKTDREFLQERLVQSGCDAITHRDKAVLRKRLYDHIVSLATDMGARRVVVVVDEAQELQYGQYEYLTSGFNELERRAVRPFFMLVGQPELVVTRSSFLSGDGHRVIGRFMVHRHEYRGIALDDFAKVLAAFDDPSDGEAGCAAFRALPNAFAAGWRVVELAPLLVEAVKLVAQQHNITEDVRVPMQYLRGLLLASLYWLVNSKCPPNQMPLAAAVECVKASGFVSVLLFYVRQSTARATAAEPAELSA